MADSESRRQWKAKSDEILNVKNATIDNVLSLYI